MFSLCRVQLHLCKILFYSNLALVYKLSFWVFKNPKYFTNLRVEKKITSFAALNLCYDKWNYSLLYGLLSRNLYGISADWGTLGFARSTGVHVWTCLPKMRFTSEILDEIKPGLLQTCRF